MMSKPLQVVCTLAGGVAVVVGVALLLVLAQYSTTGLVVGIVLVLAGAAVFHLVPVARARMVRSSLVLALLATVGVWTVARYGISRDAEPVAPEAAQPTGPDARASAEALARGLQMARDSLAALDDVTDYTCTWAKRERARSFLGRVRLTDERLLLKVRHSPRSVYLRYVQPEGKAGTEAIHVAGRNDGKLIAHSTRAPLDLLGTLRLAPTEWMAMIDQRYPITRLGLRTLSEEFLRLAEVHAGVLADCHVQFLYGRTVDGRPCHCLEVVAPAPLEGLSLALARIVWDEAWKIPVHLERWDYVTEDGRRVKRLVESHTATDLRFDVGLVDLDFDPENPAYGY